MKITNRDPTLTPYDQVARMYSLRHPNDPISPQRAQVIGVSALLKIRAQIKRDEICKRIKGQQTRSTL